MTPNKKEIWMSNHLTFCIVGYKEFFMVCDIENKIERSCKKYGFIVKVCYPNVLIYHSDVVDKTPLNKVPPSLPLVTKRVYPYDDKRSYRPFDINDVKIIKRGIHYEFKYRHFSCITRCDEHGRGQYMDIFNEEHGIEVYLKSGGTCFRILDNNKLKSYERGLGPYAAIW